MKKTALFLAILMICLLAAACNTQDNDDNGTTAATQNDPNSDDTPGEPVDEEFKYNYPDVKYGGEKFVILNNTNDWSFITTIVPESQVGEVLNDAMWTRNNFINEQFNLELEELIVPVGNVAARVRTAVQANSQEFDAVFCPGSMGGNTVGAMIAEGSIVDLQTLPELNLDSPWWNQKALEDAKIGSSSAIYFAASDISIHTLQCPWVIYFNEDMFREHDLDRPYQLVRDGKWTYDRMHEYMRAVAAMNADESFTPYRANGTSIYGLSTAIPAIGEMLRGANVYYVGKDNDNMPIFRAGEQRFIDAAQKLADILTGEGMHTDGAAGNTHYELVFINGRSLFVYAEFKAGSVYRDNETTFGIVPSPKYDDNQESYVHNLTQEAPVFIVPVSTPDIQKTAIVIDAMAYLSQKDVTPVFFGITMSQKELRNEESVEMLQIIRDTSIFDVGRIYSWSNTINQQVYADIVQGGGSLSSIIERNEQTVNNAIDRTIAQLEG